MSMTEQLQRFTTDFTEGDGKGWEETRHPGGSIELDNPKFGKLEFGKRPEGYGGWVFQELGGGGTVVLPYVNMPDGQSYIGLLQLTRRTVDNGEETIYEAIRGFKLKEASHTQSGIEEAQQEGGINLNIAERVIEYDAVPGNPNSTFFVTHPSQGEGVKFVGIPFGEQELDRDETTGYYRLKPEYFTGVKEQMEGIKNESPVFVPVAEVSKITGDLFSRSGAELLLEEDVTRLLGENAQLKEQNRTLEDEKAALESRVAELEAQLAAQQGASSQVAAEVGQVPQSDVQATPVRERRFPRVLPQHIDEMKVGEALEVVALALLAYKEARALKRHEAAKQREKQKLQRQQQRHDNTFHAVHGVTHKVQDLLPARAKEWLLTHAVSDNAPIDLSDGTVEQFVHVPHMQQLYRVVTQNREQDFTGILGNEQVQKLLSDYAKMYPDTPAPALKIMDQETFDQIGPEDHERNVILLANVDGEPRYKIGMPEKSRLKTFQNRLKGLLPQKKTA